MYLVFQISTRSPQFDFQVGNDMANEIFLAGGVRSMEQADHNSLTRSIIW